MKRPLAIFIATLILLLSTFSSVALANFKVVGEYLKNSQMRVDKAKNAKFIEGKKVELDLDQVLKFTSPDRNKDGRENLKDLHRGDRLIIKARIFFQGDLGVRTLKNQGP